MHVEIDFNSLVALLFALIALAVAFLQVTQQYASTAYDYRLCSRRAMGGWASRTRRRWIWKEIRFEVTFATPRIAVRLRSQPQAQVDSQSPTVQEREEHIVDLPGCENSSWQQYRFRDCQEIGRPQWFSIKQKPWFLSSDHTIPGARCPWLTFLQDTALTNLEIMIDETRSSCDFVPDGLKRPVAAMDRNSFLTIMSLFGIQWTDKGAGFNFSGTADFFEVTSADVMNFGRVHLYNRYPRWDDDSEQSNPNINTTRYSIESERARLAMFNCFDLGFTTIRTHNASELSESLLEVALDGATISLLINQVKRYAWAVRDPIASWAVPSMPKMVNKKNKRKDEDEDEYEFKSMFSSRFTATLMGDSVFAAMLLGGDHDITTSLDDYYKSRADSIDSVKALTRWAKEYRDLLPSSDERKLVHHCLKWVASQNGNVMNDPCYIPFPESEKALQGIRALDAHLEIDLLSNVQGEDRQKIKLEFCRQQIKSGSTFDSEMSRAHRDHEHNGNKRRDFYFEADRVGSAYYQKVPVEIESHLNGDSRLARNLMMNRLMRASLWCLHNGNAPSNQSPGVCSLSSRLLESSFTIYVS